MDTIFSSHLEKEICLKTGLSCKDQAISFEKKKKWLLNLHIAPPPGFL